MWSLCGLKMIDPIAITISTEYIKMDSFLKFASACDTGGEAKMVIHQGKVQVNGKVCLERGRKIRPGNRVQFGESLFIAEKGGEVI